MAQAQDVVVQLFNQQIGTVLILDELNEPGGLDAFSITEKRDRDGDGLIIEFSLNLDFVKAGREYIKSVYENEGSDGIISISIYSYNANEYKYNIIEYQGQLQLDNYEINETSVSTSLERIGFQRKFLNLKDRSVSTEATQSRLGVGIGAAQSIDITLEPKTIQEKAILKSQVNPEFIESSFIAGLTDGFINSIRIGGTNNSSDFENTALGVDAWLTGFDDAGGSSDFRNQRNYVLKTSQGGEYIIDFNNFIFDVAVEVASLGGTPNYQLMTVKVLYSVLSGQFEPPFPLVEELGSISLLRNDYDSEVEADGKFRFEKYGLQLPAQVKTENLNPGDEVYIWLEYGIDFIGGGADGRNIGYRLSENFNFQIQANTIFPATQAKSFMVYEYLEHIFQFLTDQVDCFRSDFFGRTDSSLVYPEDGLGSLLALTNGRAIRQLENQNLFTTWEDAFQSLNSLFCLGWDFETLENGTQVIRVEPKEYFYRKNEIAFNFSQISDLRKFADIKLLYSNVEYGYPEIENINQTNGVDEFNSRRKVASPLTNITTTLDIRSVYRASGYEIESQRRLIDSTNESKLDEEIFFLTMKRDGIDLVLEQGRDFEFVNNVIDPDSAYNVRISPARNLKNWGQILASNVIRNEDKSFKFSFGDYNFEMESKLASEFESVLENGDLDLSNVEALYYPEKYFWKSEFSSSDNNVVQQQRYGVLQAEDWDGNLIEGYRVEQDRKIVDNEGEFFILRAFRPE